jgi:hypothetical protein
LRSAPRGALCICAPNINATSRPQQKNRNSTHKQAAAGNGGQLAVARDSASRHHHPVVL